MCTSKVSNSNTTRYKYVVYVDATSSSSIKADLQAWVRSLGDIYDCDAWEDAMRMLNTAPQDERWILIFDNADDPALDFAAFLPKNTAVTVIITSRNRDLGNYSTTCHLELGEMNVEEALATLLHASRRQLPLSIEEMQNTHILLNELGCLPVALVQAGSYCFSIGDVSQPYSFTQYLSLFRVHRDELMKKAGSVSGDSYKRGVYASLDISYNALPQIPQAFLRLVSYFHYSDIPLEALATAAKYAFQDPHSYLPRPQNHSLTVSKATDLLSINAKWSELQVQEIVRTLRSFSLLTASSINDCTFLHLHPLVQAWSRGLDSQDHRAMAIQTLTACGDEKGFGLNKHLLPHILDILDQIQLQDLHVNDMVAFGAILKQQGHYRKARTLFEAALEIMKKSEESADVDVLRVKSWLARTYRKEGKLDEAEKLLVEVLEQRRRILGEKHLDTIRASANLASIYDSQGRQSEAEKLDLDVVKQYGMVLGKNHPDTVQAIANLAATYHSQGRWNKAENLYLEVLEHYKTSLGSDHPDTATITANLASTYAAQGMWDKAEKLSQIVVEQRKQLLGANHPYTIKSIANLATIYRSQGRLEESIALMEPVVQLSLKVLGCQHPSTQNRLRAMIRCYKRMGEYQKAEELKPLLLSGKENEGDPDPLPQSRGIFSSISRLQIRFRRHSNQRV